MEDQNLPEIAKDVNPYQLMDALDDEIIKAELENRIVEHWVYAFKQDGKIVSNLSKAGVDACCTEMAKQGHIIEEQPVQFSQDPGDPHAMLFTVVATRVLVDFKTSERLALETVNGAKRQSMKGKGGKFNPFWFEQGAMKAARNARIRLIPEEIKVQILALAREKKLVKSVTPEDAERLRPETEVTRPREQTGDVIYADDKLKRYLEMWIRDNLGGDRELFKEWATALKMIHTYNGKPTMNRVIYRFASRIRSNPDDAAANFAIWYDMKKAKENVKEVFGDEATEENLADSRQ